MTGEELMAALNRCGKLQLPVYIGDEEVMDCDVIQFTEAESLAAMRRLEDRIVLTAYNNPKKGGQVNG